MFKAWRQIFKDPSCRKTFDALSYWNEGGQSWSTTESLPAYTKFMGVKKHILSIVDYVDEKFVYVQWKSWELPRCELYGVIDDFVEKRPRIGPFVMAVEFVLSVRSIT